MTSYKYLIPESDQFSNQKPAMTTVLKTCSIPPSPGGAAELTVPLTYLDVTWIHFIPIRRLLFYNHPCSEPHFLETIVPQLKHSLSQTLSHYLPVAGNLLYPSDTAQKPLIRYAAGDSVPLTIAVSTNDFDHLTGNHARDADQFYDFMPPPPPATDGAGYKIVPLFALQATLFPGRGICIGFSNHHVLGDASSIVGFIRAWASATILGGGAAFPVENLPVFDRGVISDPHGLDTVNWEVMREIPFTPPPSSFPLPTNRVRATFLLNRADIEKLKNSISAKNPGPAHISSFVVTTSYVWSCLAKSGDVVGEEAENGGVDYFIFVVDVRARADPPVPTNYFGNCLSFAAARVERRRLAAAEGFEVAAEAVGREIREKVNKKGEVLKGMENWRESYKELSGIVRPVGVSGSPKFDLSGADFGWGEARKMEVLSIDGEKYSMSLCKSKDFDGGFEVGLSLSRERMEAFAAIFAQGLKNLV